MTRHFLRVTFAVLALFLAVAGSVNLRRASAGICQEICPVPPRSQQMRGADLTGRVGHNVFRRVGVEKAHLSWGRRPFPPTPT